MVAREDSVENPRLENEVAALGKVPSGLRS